MKKRTTAYIALLTQCALSTVSAVLPIEGKNNAPMPAGMPKPAKNVPYTDPVYQTNITRVTNAATDGVNPFAINIYSRIQSFNSNNTRMLLFTSTGGIWSLYNAVAPYNKIKTITAPRLGGGNAEPQWDPVNPDLFYYFNEDGTDKKLYSYNVVTNVHAVVADFNGRLPWAGVHAISTKAEGSPSADGRYWAFVCDNASWQRIGFFTWDKQTNTILGTLTSTTANGFLGANHVSMSPSGNNVVISVYGGPGAVQYDRTLTTRVRQLARIGEHSDMAKLPNGNDAYVSVDNQNGDVYFIDMGTGVKTVLYNLFANGGNSAIHFSGRAFNKPGWALISTFYKEGPLRWDHDKVFAIELKANPRIYILGHHHGATMPAGQYYWPAPKATTNRDLTKILFTSNWEVVSQTALDSYMVNLSPSDIPNSGEAAAVVVDNPKVSNLPAYSVAYTPEPGYWTHSTGDTTFYNSTKSVTNQVGHSVEFKFTGTKASLWGKKASGLGKLKIYVNGTLVTTVDCYSATTLNQVKLFETDLLPLQLNSLKATVDWKNPLSSSNFIGIDKFEYQP